MLTDAFLLYASHLVNGRVDHRRLYPEWVVNQRSADLTEVIRRALKSGEMEEELDDLAPHYPGYDKLKEKFIEYRSIAENGGWPQIPQGPKLYKGSRGKRVAILRQRLMVSGYLDPMAENKSDIFDHDLETAVRTFQKRHGLKDDGRVGKSTLEALNVSVEKRIRQIALNMDRMRWLPDDIMDRNIFVNIADFSLDIIEGEKSVLTMRIIAGKKDWRSCVLSAKMTYLELNPFWKVPDSIAVKEILPHIKKDPDYLAKKNIKVLRDWNDKAKEIDPKTIDWSGVRVKNFPYRFRQEPGPGNPLGRVKFIFPNACEIYLHDTPTRSLFGRESRAFSHGCIRVEKPMELAAYLLKKKEAWTSKKILAEIRKGKRQVVMLPDPINVLIFYGTAWVDREGVLQFRNDIYRIDEIPYELPVSRARASTAAN
jgi:murein L,D-transpeptidase YcbB/YkuD